MTSIQELEIGRYYDELKQDVQDLVDRYLRIADWEIPDNDERTTLQAIFTALRRAVDEVEAEWEK